MASETCPLETWTLVRDSAQARALDYVAAQSSGGPMEPDLWVTLNFHPDRQKQGVSVMQALASEGIHGPLRLASDVEALVLDPCYKGTQFESLAHEFPCRVEWHPGYRLDVSTLRQIATYRGFGSVILGEAIAREGCVTAAVIGEAARKELYEEEDLKKLWHCVARFGRCSLSSATFSK